MPATVSGVEMLLKTQIFKSLLKVKGGGTGEDKNTHLGTRIAGGESRLCWQFLHSAPSPARSDALLQSLLPKVGAGTGCHSSHGLGEPGLVLGEL